jgi:murein DD-endopeptidase MepM/ murein hydrolase activator NlpD
MNEANNRPGLQRRLGLLVFAALLAAAAAMAIAVGAPAQSLNEIQSRIDENRARLDEKQGQLEQAESREGVLSSKIEKFGDQLDQLRGEVATLRNRIAIVQTQLRKKEAELKEAKARLDALRERLRRSLRILEDRLVAIYQSGSPDTLTVILDSRGFDDMVSRYQYLQQIQAQDTSIAIRVKNLRNEMKETVERVRAARDAIAAKKAELERTQAQLEARESDLVAARQENREVLSQVYTTQEELEGDISGISATIESQLQAQQEAQAAAAAAAAESTGATPPPVGPVQGESSSGFIWPVSGPVTSPFCEARAWESCHPGIDIGVPAGTPIQASAAGTVSIAGPNDGYGNYTCIDHGSGISTCYAHQSVISVSVGQSVSQGQVIGSVGCTGLCFGDHLHFEVRVNGSVVDPMGYLS